MQKTRPSRRPEASKKTVMQRVSREETSNEWRMFVVAVGTNRRGGMKREKRILGARRSGRGCLSRCLALATGRKAVCVLPLRLSQSALCRLVTAIMPFVLGCGCEQAKGTLVWDVQGGRM